MKIMGILNVTPDSFSDGGKYIDLELAVAHAKKLINDGAHLIDIGGESTRPGATVVTEEEELKRVIPVIKALRKHVDVPISIDTYKAEVAKQAVLAGAALINDVTAGNGDELMYETMAAMNVPVILTHNRKKEEETTSCDDIVAQVKRELQRDANRAIAAGVSADKIIIDPGIGFGKSLEQNIQLLKGLKNLQQLGYPVMLAASKKRTIKALSDSELPEDLTMGTVATTLHAYAQGMDYVRVHDVKENAVALKVFKKISKDGMMSQ